MKNYIFDREKEKILTDDDGVKIHFASNDEVYAYLSNQCGFADDFIDSNFYIMKSIKIIPLLKN